VGVSCDADSFGLGTGAGLVHGTVRWRAYDARSLHGLGIWHSFFAVSHSSIPLILWRYSCKYNKPPYLCTIKSHTTKGGTDGGAPVMRIFSKELKKMKFITKY
jgi:hypothetical protein